MRNLAVVSLHTSPLAQPGIGDGGGMNIYVRELCSALARTGVECDIYTRADGSAPSATIEVEPGMRVHYVTAGPAQGLAKSELASTVAQFTASVLEHMGGPGCLPDAIHSHYWLSGLVGHSLKHQLDRPLISTFHTLARVKAATYGSEDPDEPIWRAEAEEEIMGCSDAVVVSSHVEAEQLEVYYGTDPARMRILSPGVDHAYYGPGNRVQARRALGLPSEGPLLLFVGRIQPLKGADIAIRVLGGVARAIPNARLVVVGGPSGPSGEAELKRIRKLAVDLDLVGQVRFVEPQPHELLSTYYRAADVCLVPSRSESFGLVAVEAAACGTPVVASQVGGLLTLVDHGRTGFLVPSGEVEGFVDRSLEIIEDPLLAQAMAHDSARRARRYRWSQAAANLVRWCDALAEERLVECR